MTNLPPLHLDPDLDPWERQPGESITRHNQFCIYRDDGRTRSLRKTAEKLTKNPRYIRDVAAAFKWAQRAEAWDRHRDELDEQAWIEERRKAREVDSRILGAAVGKIAQRLPNLKADELSAAEVTRLLDVAMRHRRALFGDPTTTVAVTGPDGDPWQRQLAEFIEMPPERRRATLAALAEAVRRRAEAADGVGEDDD